MFTGHNTSNPILKFAKIQEKISSKAGRLQKIMMTDQSELNCSVYKYFSCLDVTVGREASRKMELV